MAGVQNEGGRGMRVLVVQRVDAESDNHVLCVCEDTPEARRIFCDDLAFHVEDMDLLRIAEASG
jgi:predicted AAA+ superfamily ATPase